MKGNIIEASGIPADTNVYLKKDMFGYRVVEPIYNEDGKIMWKRIILGTWRERAFLLFIAMIILFGYLGFQEQINNYYEVLNNPCAYCNSCQEQTRTIIQQMNNAEVKNRLSGIRFNFVNLTNSTP